MMPLSKESQSKFKSVKNIFFPLKLPNSYIVLIFFFSLKMTLLKMSKSREVSLDTLLVSFQAKIKLFHSELSY